MKRLSARSMGNLRNRIDVEHEVPVYTGTNELKWVMITKRFPSMQKAKKFAIEVLSLDRQTAVRLHEVIQEKQDFGDVKEWRDVEDHLLMDCHDEDYKRVLGL